MPIPNAHDATLDLDRGVTLIELPNADEVALQARDEVGACQSLLLAARGGEDDRALALNGHQQTIGKADRAGDALVELGENILPASHVVRCAGIEVPLISMAVTINVEVELGARLLQVDFEHSRGALFCEAASASSVLEQQSRVLYSSGAHTLAMSSAGPSSSSSARLARSRPGLRQSLAQWSYLPQLRHRLDCL
jgi:hypothetical protein